MIPKEIYEKIRLIEIRTTKLVNETFGGEYHSAFKGQGMEFSEVREYTYGDDVRNIDWNVTAKAGKPHIKLFDEEREMAVMFLVDISRSNLFGSDLKLKSEIAAEIAALLAFAAVQNNDKVGLITFTDELETYIPLNKGRQHVLHVAREILYAQAKGTQTDLAKIIRKTQSILSRKTLVFIISDFLDSNYEKPLQILGRKHDIVAIAIKDPRETFLPPVGLINLMDCESGEIVTLNTSGRSFQDNFQEQQRKKHFATAKNLQSAGIDLIEIDTSKPYVNPISKFFLSRNAKR